MVIWDREGALRNMEANKAMFLIHARAVMVDTKVTGSVTVAGAGPSLGTTLVPKSDIVIANQSSAPYLLKVESRVDWVVVTDPGEAVLKRARYAVEEGKGIRWLVSTAVDPEFLKALVKNGREIFYFAHVLENDPKYNAAVEESLPSVGFALSMLQMGSVLSAQVGMAYLMWPNISTIRLRGVDFGWSAWEYARVPDVIRKGDRWVFDQKDETGEVTAFGDWRSTELLTINEAQFLKLLEIDQLTRMVEWNRTMFHPCPYCGTMAKLDSTRLVRGEMMILRRFKCPSCKKTSLFALEVGE